jgi:hypothetical protein
MHSIVRNYLVIVTSILLLLTVSSVDSARAINATGVLDKDIEIGQGWPVTTKTGFEEGVVSSEIDTATTGATESQ